MFERSRGATTYIRGAIRNYSFPSVVDIQTASITAAALKYPSSPFLR